MYRININTELLNSLSGKYDNIVYDMCEAAEKLRFAANHIDELAGFDIESSAEILRQESTAAEELGKKFIELIHKTNHAAEIYSDAEKNIEKDIDDLPILIHGSISRKCRAAEIYENEHYDLGVDLEINESSIICDNAVMHEDWVIKLIAENKYGG